MPLTCRLSNHILRFFPSLSVFFLFSKGVHLVPGELSVGCCVKMAVKGATWSRATANSATAACGEITAIRSALTDAGWVAVTRKQVIATCVMTGNGVSSVRTSALASASRAVRGKANAVFVRQGGTEKSVIKSVRPVAQASVESIQVNVGHVKLATMGNTVTRCAIVKMERSVPGTRVIVRTARQVTGEHLVIGTVCQSTAGSVIATEVRASPVPLACGGNTATRRLTVWPSTRPMGAAGGVK